MAAPPRILFVTTNVWGTDFLLVRALRRAGVLVAMLCPCGHPVRSAQLDHVFDLAPFRAGPLASNSHRRLRPGRRRAGRRARPPPPPSPFIVAARLTSAALWKHRSGAPSSYDLMISRDANMEAARAAGVPVPGLISDVSRANLEVHLRSARAGIVLKADDTWGGNGVRICRSSDEIVQAISELGRPPLLRALKLWLMDGDAAVLAYCLSGAAPSLSAQECLPVGRVGDLALFCREGVVLGLTCAEREVGNGELGPSTIIRIVERDALAAAARRFVSHHGLSGFIGFDFIVDPVTDEARVIEINPRATPRAGIRPRHGPSPAAAAAAGLGAAPIQDEVAFRPLVAYFPKAWQAHPEDARLAACAADIPSDEPELVTALLDRARKDPRGRFRRLRQLRVSRARHGDAPGALPVVPVVPV